MRLLYLMVDGAQASDDELERKTRQADEVMPPGTTFCPRQIPIGPRYYHESAVGLALCVPGILEAIRHWQSEFDAILIGCFMDPGVRAARTVSRVPVVGAGQAAMALAQTIADRFGVVTILPSNVPDIEYLASGLGLRQSCVGVTSIGMPADKVNDDHPAALAALEQAGRGLLELGAKTLVLGCLSFSFEPFAAELSSRLGVPVIDPLRAGVMTAYAHVRLGLHPSLLAHPRNDRPEELEWYLDKLSSAPQGG
jgi:allantoin racemase